MTDLIEQQRLKEFLTYDPDTGVFTRNISAGGNLSGTVAGCLCKSSGYVLVGIDYVLYRAHRLAWLYVHGEMPDDEIDHIDHIRDNNRIVNLRQVSRAENCKNATMNRNNKSGKSGVWLDPENNKWESYIWIKNRKKKLGRFADKSDAIEARINAESELKYHANHGKQEANK